MANSIQDNFIYNGIFTTPEYTEEVENLARDITTQNIKLSSFRKEKYLQEERTALRRKHDALFTAFQKYDPNIKTIEDLQERLIKYREVKLPFSGGMVRRFFSDKSAMFYNEESLAKIDALFTKVLLTTFKNNRKKIYGKDLNKAILELFNKDIKAGSFQFTSSQGFQMEKNFSLKITDSIQQAINQIDINNIVDSDIDEEIVKQFVPYLRKLVDYSKMTTEQQQRFNQLLSSHNSNIITIGDLQLDLNSASCGWQVILHDGKEALTKTKLKKKYGDDLTEVRKRNEAFIEYLRNLCDAESWSFLERIIREGILAQEPYFFFTGEADSQIVGNFGEIEAMYYLARLLYPTASAMDVTKILVWRGGTSTGEKNQKPHQDILLEQVFGIQVKNTQEDLLHLVKEHTVNFQNLSMGGFLDKIGLDEDTKLVFEKYFSMYLFNIPYEQTQSKEAEYRYKPTNIDIVRSNGDIGKEFANSYEKLRGLSSGIDKMMSLFATIFLYMDTSEQLKENIEEKVDLNTLYLFGGIIPLTAFSIMEQIIEEFDKKDFSSIRVFPQYKSGPKDNIVTVLNASRGLHKDIQQRFAGEINLVASYVMW